MTAHSEKKQACVDERDYLICIHVLLALTVTVAELLSVALPVIRPRLREIVSAIVSRLLVTALAGAGEAVGFAGPVGVADDWYTDEHSGQNIGVGGADKTQSFGVDPMSVADLGQCVGCGRSARASERATEGERGAGSAAAMPCAVALDLGTAQFSAAIHKAAAALCPLARR